MNRVHISDTNKNPFSDLSDHELVELYGKTGDPLAFEMLKAEERRRISLKALSQANVSNKIAIGSLIISVASLIVANNSCVKIII